MRPSVACAACVAAVAVAHTSTSCSAFTHVAVKTGSLSAAASSTASRTTIPRSRDEGCHRRRANPWTTTSSAPRCLVGGSRHARRRSTLSMSAHSSADGDGDGERTDGLSRWVEGGKKWLAGVALASTLLGGGAAGLFGANELVFAATPEETKEIGICLLGQCRTELAQCLLNPKCFANIICLQTCNGRPDEGYCQIRCGDLFENEAVGKFNACAVSKKNCVKQRQDDGSWPVPPIEAQAKSFNPKIMEGQWYISAGLNPAFDCFDCQVHFFNSPKPGQLVGKLNWRIKEPDGEFFTRDVVQKFAQDPKNPAHLVNKDNEYLHYRDDWYVLDSEPNSHVLVVYRGSNDAWDGYGGGTLYTKDKTVPPGLVERVKAKSEAAGIPWRRWQENDNTCSPQTAESSEMLREKYAKKLLMLEGQQLQEGLTAVRGYAAQEVDDVEASTLETLEDLKQEYEVEVEQLGSDLAAAFEAELAAFEATLSDDVKSITDEATRIEQEAGKILTGN